MKVLGIHDGHNSSAALMIDGVICAAVSEERLTHRKNEMNYPLLAVEECLKIGGIKKSEIDYICFSMRDWCPSRMRLKREFKFTIRDWLDEQEFYWKPKLIEKRDDAEDTYYPMLLKQERFQEPHHYPLNDYPLNFKSTAEERIALTEKIRKEFCAKHYGLTPSQVLNFDHHTCHAHYAYFGSPLRDAPCLVFTNDAGGDATNGTVWIAENDVLREESRNNCTDLGRLYSYITLLLSMNIGEHEFKVMGLAPYASDYEIAKARGVFDELFTVDKGMVVYKNRPSDLFFHFRERLAHCRFDGIAGALQEMIEKVGTAWIKENILKHGIHRIVYSGGVSMNVKQNQKICEIPEVNEFYCPGSGGDESCSMGACYVAASQLTPKVKLSGVRNLYLGGSFSRNDIENAIKEHNSLLTQFVIKRDVTTQEIAQLLADGSILGRLSGRMEFGARSLGNRSILANPSRNEIVQKINRQIKFRDFWMPFAPSMLDSFAPLYVINEKNLLSDHMTLAFETTERGRKDIPAALHPADFTARAHIVTREINPGYYDLIHRFSEITGIGCLMNTSFNLHGEPSVYSPRHALHTLLNSGLDGVVLEDVLILRR